jgi:hypothetical protein
MPGPTQCRRMSTCLAADEPLRRGAAPCSHLSPLFCCLLLIYPYTTSTCNKSLLAAEQRRLFFVRVICCRPGPAACTLPCHCQPLPSQGSLLPN